MSDELSDELRDVVEAAILAADNEWAKAVDPPRDWLSDTHIEHLVDAVVDAIDRRFEVPR